MIISKLNKCIVPLICGLITILLMRLIFFIGYVQSPSMEPAISQDSYVLGIRIFSNLKSGDIIIFKHGDRILVKRIAAVPGDIVYMDDNSQQAFINEFIKTATRTLTVPAGCYFVLGDNELDSWDSRYWEDVWVNEREIVAYVP